MAANVYSTATYCTDYLRIGTKFCHQRQLNLFAQSDPLEIVAIDILEPLPWTDYVKWLVVVIADSNTTLS